MEERELNKIDGVALGEDTFFRDRAELLSRSKRICKTRTKMQLMCPFSIWGSQVFNCYKMYISSSSVST